MGEVFYKQESGSNPKGGGYRLGRVRRGGFFWINKNLVPIQREEGIG